MAENTSFFSDICVKQCGGMCCDPWWGIIAYTVVKENGFSKPGSFREELVRGLKARARRIIDGYVTDEKPARPLFSSPEKYNVVVRDIKVSGNTVTISLVAMYAFRCRFLSEDKTCAIHPFILGEEIRPARCGLLGSLDARPDEEGHCRIIHAAKNAQENGQAVEKAIDAEKNVNEKYYRDGFDDIGKAADSVFEKLKEYSSKHATHLLPAQKTELPGRNDQCYCGSGKKYKKCHGS